MDRQQLKRECVAKLLPRCTSKQNAESFYDSCLSGIQDAAWYLMNLATRDEVATTTILKSIKDDVTDIVVSRWLEDDCKHFPNNSDVAHAIGIVLVLRTHPQEGEVRVYERVDY